MADVGRDPISLPQFAELSALFAQNIGYCPKVSYDRTTSLGHRVRIYRDPPAADIIYSERSLARYIELADFIFVTGQKKNPRLLAGGLLIIVGGYWLRSNRLAGLALIAKGFQEARYKMLPHHEVVMTAQSAAARAEVMPLIHLLLPLSHEIGHLPESQALCPQVYFSDEILETYRMNYLRIHRFTGDFDYKPGLSDPASPLNISLLREEAASDFFAVSAMFWLIYRSLAHGESYPLDLVSGGVLMFPLVMGLDALCFGTARTTADLQATTLAMQCRYSLMIDSLRSCAKNAFSENPDFPKLETQIDRSIDTTVSYFDDLFQTTWDAFLTYFKEAPSLMTLDSSAALRSLGEVEDARQQFAMADYIGMIADEVDGYCVTAENISAMKAYIERLRTFRTVIINGDFPMQSRFGGPASTPVTGTLVKFNVGCPTKSARAASQARRCRPADLQFALALLRRFEDRSPVAVCPCHRLPRTGNLLHSWAMDMAALCLAQATFWRVLRLT